MYTVKKQMENDSVEYDSHQEHEIMKLYLF